jgi:ubiquinol-cytochrome c reductase cytochrome b subunit
MMVRRTIGWLDERLGSTAVVNVMLKKIYPDHWSFYLGEFALYFFLALVATGIWLSFAFDASAAHAYESVLVLANRTQPIGYFIRQIHHWAAVCFIAAILIHMGRIFFTGAFRKPRELNWMIGFAMLVLAVFTGLTGYSLPNDLLSGTGLRITDSVALAIPFIGRWAADVLNGADSFPGALLITHLYTLHVYYLPVIIGGLMAAHLGLLLLQKHTQFVRDPEHVVGRRFYPDYALRTMAALGATFGVLSLLATFFEINPIGDYGPYKPWLVSNSVVPDWYTGFLDGALRIGPPIQFTVFGHPVPSVFWPGLVLPIVTVGVLLLWPFIEARFTHDADAHDVLDTPTQAPPIRMAVGCAIIFEGLLLTVAAGDDQTAVTLHTPLPTLVWIYRILFLVGPFVIGWLAVRVSRERRARIVDSGSYPSDVTTLVRNADGGFDEERPQPV